jgi:UDP-galactopyranose mutase
MYLIVGCGLSGVTIAERIATVLNEKVLIIEKRDHIGGNCYDFVEKETGILVCKYGAHLFKTNNKQIWKYVNQFSEWVRWEHKVLSYVDDKFVSVPVNITTVNELCNENIQTSDEMDEWLDKVQIKYDTITNSEQMCKSRVGNILYDKMFRNYTYKQWNKYPEELNASVLQRISVRNNHDPRYFEHKYQALPKRGYTKFIENIIKHDNITVELNTSYVDFMKTHDVTEFKGIIFTGPIDDYFAHKNIDKLEYRSLNFETKIYKNMNYYQPNSVVNYPELNVPFTRIVEYKHFLNQQSKDTIIVSETSSDVGEPFYPVPNKRNLDLYEKYKSMAAKEEKNNIYFVGRLANYKYFNMDEAMANALLFFESKLLSGASQST